MPLLLVPLILLILVTPVVLMPFSLVMRYRRGTARRQARGWVAAVNVITLAISSTLFLVTSTVTTFWVPRALPYALTGLATGALLGFIGLWLSRWEPASESLHYTPNRWLVLTLITVVTARIFYGFWRAWHAWRHVPDGASWLAAAGVAGSLAMGGVVLGYYLVYWIGVGRRLRRHTRTAARV
jgi:hypothetical protein